MFARIREKLIAFRQKTALSNKRIAALFIVLLTVIALPLMVIVSQQEQDIRQRASELVSPPASLPPTSNPLPPNSNFNSIEWKTDHVSLKADDFYITANGSRYLAKTSDIKLSSNAPFPPDFKTTSLEAEWKENGANMRMFIYIYKENEKWYIDELRTYDGGNPGDWIYYKGFLGNDIGLPLKKSTLDLLSIQNPPSSTSPSKANTGNIHFTNVILQPFLVQIPKTGYYIYRSDSAINVPVDNNPAIPTSYNLYTFLFKDGSIVKDQSKLSYVWSINNGKIATIEPYSLAYDCETNSIMPSCPQSRLKIVGLQSGFTTIELRIEDSSTKSTIANTTFNLTVGSSTPTPTPTSIPTPTPKPSITVISPNGGEKWQIGKTYNVTWNYSGPKDCTVSVFLTNFSANPASYAGNALPISASLKKYSFKISPVIPQGENVYKIEVNGGKMCGVSDQSDKYLSVVAPSGCTVCSADVNGNGTVDSKDLNTVNRCFGKATTVNCVNADVNKDGIININDTTCVSLNYNKKCVK